jgi:Mg2+-importing ATPase
MDSTEVLAELDAHRDGLTADEAKARLKSHGPNVVTSSKPPSWWWLLLSVIPNPFNLLLGFIAIISVASPERSWVSANFCKETGENQS